jgi:hypothetical protein
MVRFISFMADIKPVVGQSVSRDGKVVGKVTEFTSQGSWYQVTAAVDEDTYQRVAGNPPKELAMSVGA